MRIFKALIRLVFGEKLFTIMSLYKQNFADLRSLTKSYYKDALLYYKHSTVFKQNTFNKIEALIVLRYHSIEKGLLHNETRLQFGKQNVIELCRLLKNKDVIANRQNSQIASAYLALCSYYELHEKNNNDISDYFSKADYDLFKKYSDLNLPSVKMHQLTTYFENSNKDFYHFSNSRCSVRNFSREMVPLDTLQNIIELAKNAPSVCNRQSVKVYYIEDKMIIERIFAIQQGLKGYSEEVLQLLVVISDRNYFYTIGERNQMYIDGGIFLMNLLYAIHYYKVAACPAHWGLNIDSDLKIMNLLNLPESAKVIALVPIGIPNTFFNTTLSLRRSVDEIFTIVS